MPPQKTEVPSRARKTNSINKPKGAVRAKSGCYTCRIRRKVSRVTPILDVVINPWLIEM